MLTLDIHGGWATRTATWLAEAFIAPARDMTCPLQFVIELDAPLQPGDEGLRCVYGVKMIDRFEWGGRDHIVVEVHGPRCLEGYLAVSDPNGRALVSRLIVPWHSEGMDDLPIYQRFAFLSPVV